MIAKILSAGSGGQGVLTMGNILANAAMLQDLFVTFLPEYGAAMRGGTANCTVTVSDNDIASPVASSPDIVVALNGPSAIKFLNKLQPGGEMLYNSNVVDSLPIRGDLQLLPVPAIDIARDLGNERSSNMVMLGALIKHINIIDVEMLYQSIEILLSSKKKLVDISKKAVEKGYTGFPF
jgi:2-oxoglutarate ferredoxin oxidoreductase subunit gamma